MVDVQADIRESLKESLSDAAQFYCCHPDDLWCLTDRGFLFKLFQESNATGKHVDSFAEVINQVIKDRQGKIKQSCKGRVVAGRILTFDPSATMYDGISEEVTGGFFDSDDLPPPEFWVGMVGEKLAAFIPSVFISRASEGVECCMGGCLEWADEFEVIL